MNLRIAIRSTRSTYSSIATEIAYRDGAAWLDALLTYLQGNIAFIKGFFTGQCTQRYID